MRPAAISHDPNSETDIAPGADRVARSVGHHGCDCRHLPDALRRRSAHGTAAGPRALPAVLSAFAANVYFILGLHRNKWRFTSIPDLYNLFRASTVLAISLLALDYVLVAPNIYGTFFFGKVTILLYWFLQMF